MEKVTQIKNYDISIPRLFDMEKTKSLIEEAIVKLMKEENVLPEGEHLTITEYCQGTNDFSRSFIVRVAHTHEGAEGELFNSLEKTLSNRLSGCLYDEDDRIRKEEEEKNKAEEDANKEPEVVNDNPMAGLSGMGGLGAMLGGMLGGDAMKNLDPATRAKLAETIEEADNNYWDSHIHYNVLVEAVEDFDRAVVKRIGRLIKVTGYQFDSECRQILDVFQGYFTIAGKTNYLAMREFLSDLRLSMKNELQQFCGYKKIDKEDSKKSRDVAPHMKIAQEEIHKKIEYAFDQLDIEISTRLGLLPAPKNLNPIRDGVVVEEHGQTTPEERWNANKDLIREDMDTKVSENVYEPVEEPEIID